MNYRRWMFVRSRSNSRVAPVSCLRSWVRVAVGVVSAASLPGCVDSRNFDGTLDASPRWGNSDAGARGSERGADARANEAPDAASGQTAGQTDLTESDGEPSATISSAASSPSTMGHSENSRASDETAPEPKVPERCAEGAFSCDQDERVVCQRDGTWSAVPDSEQCGGSLPVCTSNGVCAAFRLRGSITGLAPSSGDTPAPYVVRDQSFLMAARVCSERFCVAGGIVP